MRGDECHTQEKLVPSARNKPMHNARNMSKGKDTQGISPQGKRFQLAKAK